MNELTKKSEIEEAIKNGKLLSPPALAELYPRALDVILGFSDVSWATLFDMPLRDRERYRMVQNAAVLLSYEPKILQKLEFLLVNSSKNALRALRKALRAILGGELDT